MRLLKVGVCFLDEKDNVISHRPLKSNWTVDIQRELKANYNIHVIDEIANILTSSFKLELKSETIKEMLVEIKENE